MNLVTDLLGEKVEITRFDIVKGKDEEIIGKIRGVFTRESDTSMVFVVIERQDNNGLIIERVTQCRMIQGTV